MSLSVIDVTDPAGLASMPGDFSAIGADGSSVMLQSLGAAYIGATDEAGQKLEVNQESEGVVLDLRTQATANAEKLESVPEMWSFDDSTGKWELEATSMKLNGEPVPNLARPAKAATAASSGITGPERFKGKKKKKGKYMQGDYDYAAEGSRLETGCMSPADFMKKVGEDGAKSISAPIKKLGYINCDLAYHHPQRAVMLQGIVLDSQSQPMPSVQLWGVGRDYQGRTPDATGADGRFGAMIAQFDSELDVEVSYGKPLQSDDKVEVFFEDPRLVYNVKGSGGELRKLISKIPGQYVQDADASSDGQLGWVKKMGAESKAIVSWNKSRRRWENSVEGKVVFCKPIGDDTELPFGTGWQVASEFSDCPIVPKYTRAVQIMVQSFGPFKTGPPGEFVDIGQLKTDA